jgi:deoxyribodipyrimidine photo-lyase
MKHSIVWFRRDLRITDHPTLLAALSQGFPIIPLYIHSPEEEAFPLGKASIEAVKPILKKLQHDLSLLKLKLIIKSGSTEAVLKEIIKENNVETVYSSRIFEPKWIERDAHLKKSLGVEFKTYNTSLLYEPFEVKSREGNPYKVFTPFYKACLSLRTPRKPLASPVPVSLPKEVEWLETNHLPLYQEERDFPSIQGTSKLSTLLHFGGVSPFEVWHLSQNAPPFQRQLIWREFGHHLLFHFPNTPTEPLYPKYATFPWKKDPEGLLAWKEGRTGYPFVDAGMRQLYQTGWMHNRLRMVVGSFLVKDLLISWVEGAQWFWERLSDADLANNTLGWQWVGGCGADAAPYYRIFHPVTQGERFDPEGEFVRQFVPELKKMPKEWIHKPWEAPKEVLARANVVLGETYPYPLVDHKMARERALKALQEIG